MLLLELQDFWWSLLPTSRIRRDFVFDVEYKYFWEGENIKVSINLFFRFEVIQEQDSNQDEEDERSDLRIDNDNDYDEGNLDDNFPKFSESDDNLDDAQVHFGRGMRSL